MFYVLYQLVGWLLFIVASPFFLLYISFTGKHRNELAQRLGFLNKVRVGNENSLRIWLHAASVGEVQVARALVTEIKSQFPEAAIFLSTVTRQGHNVARKQMTRDIPCFYAPLDLTGMVDRALNTIKPDIYICLETELWPAILRTAHKNGTKLLLLNGRLSENSYRWYRKIRGFMKNLLNNFSIISVIQPDDAQRYINLGADAEKTVINGNAKYDLRSIRPATETINKYRDLLDIKNGQPVLMAGSTHTGEEPLLLDVFQELNNRLTDLIWIIAPRHLQRIEEIETLFAEQGIKCERLSHVKKHGRQSTVILVDSMGELTTLYSVADYVFCGGSLVKRGGHNILEVAMWGKPVFYGPSMTDFADVKELLEANEAGFPVKDPQELAGRIVYFVDHPQEYRAAGQRAKKAALAQEGSAKRHVQLLKQLIHA